MPVELQTDQQLTAEEAEQLVREYKQNGSQELRNQLVMHYSYIAKGVVNRMGSTFYKYATAEEMIHQGVISLIDSLERFDPNKDVKFSTTLLPRCAAPLSIMSVSRIGSPAVSERRIFKSAKWKQN